MDKLASVSDSALLDILKICININTQDSQTQKTFYSVVKREIYQINAPIYYFGAYLRSIFTGTRFYWSNYEFSCDGSCQGRESFIITSRVLREYYSLLYSAKKSFSNNNSLIKAIEEYVDQPIINFLDNTDYTYYEERTDSSGVINRLYFIPDYYLNDGSGVFSLCIYFYEFKNRLIKASYLLRVLK